MSAVYENNYLQQYWPEHPNNPDMWQDNLELITAYFQAADRILADEGRPLHTLDISTGPCLAPLMASMHCMETVQLSDFTATNREEIVGSPVEYWRQYATELARLFPDRSIDVDHILEGLDAKRKERPPLDVDLRRTPVFLPDQVPPGVAELITMHFVVDSICQTTEECFTMLDTALTFLKPGGWLLLSALIDSGWWLLGDVKEPSPKLGEAEVSAFLESRNLRIATKTASVRKLNQLYEGGWTIFLAQHKSPLSNA